jgi:hypothetical protein
MADTRIWKWLLDWARSLNLFPDYFQALRENFLNVIFGPSVLAVIYGIWSLIAVPPLSITLLFLGGAALLASYYVWRADHLQLVSKITLRFENREPFKQTTPMEDVLGVRFYFRVFRIAQFLFLIAPAICWRSSKKSMDAGNQRSSMKPLL